VPVFKFSLQLPEGNVPGEKGNCPVGEMSGVGNVLHLRNLIAMYFEIG